MATTTVTGTVTQTTTNGPDGAGTTWTGTVEIERLRLRDGALTGVSFEVELAVAAEGEIAAPGEAAAQAAGAPPAPPPAGTATTVFGFELGDGGGAAPLDAFVSIEAGPAAIRLAPDAPTPVSYALRASSGPLDAPALQPFKGNGTLQVPFEAFSATAAFGDPAAGPQGDGFTNANTATVTVTYTFNPAVQGTDGVDNLAGGPEPDALVAGPGDDALLGAEGGDNLFGGVGSDLIEGSAGDDALFGEAGDDTLFGGDGRDFLTGGEGEDTLTGGEGADVFSIQPNGGRDVVTDFQPGDRVGLAAFGVAPDAVEVRAALGDVELVVGDAVVAVFEDALPADVSAALAF